MAKGKKAGNKQPLNQFEDGNQFWRKRSKHGRDVIFSDPDIMWEAACEYFQYETQNTLKEHKVFGTGYSANADKMRPFSLIGLCLFLGVNTTYFHDFKSSKACTSDFSNIIATIEEVIYKQQFDGAAAGLLNTNIIARKLGLVNREDITTNDESLNGFDALMKASTSDSED